MSKLSSAIGKSGIPGSGATNCTVNNTTIKSALDDDDVEDDGDDDGDDDDDDDIDDDDQDNDNDNDEHYS